MQNWILPYILGFVCENHLDQIIDSFVKPKQTE